MTIIQNRTLPASLKGFKKLKFRLSSLNLNIAGTVALKLRLTSIISAAENDQQTCSLNSAICMTLFSLNLFFTYS